MRPGTGGLRPPPADPQGRYERRGLRGTGLIADDLWLMAHHELTGKPFLPPRALGIGLAGGLLAELMLGGCIGLRHDGVVAAGSTWRGDELPRDGLALRVLGQIAGEQPLPVRDWLLFLALTAARDIADRLEGAGYLTRAGGRFPGRASRWVPVDPDWAHMPLVRARGAVEGSGSWTVHGGVLAGMAAASGLSFRLAQHCQTPAGRGVEHVIGLLGPGLRELAVQVQAASAASVLAHRV